MPDDVQSEQTEDHSDTDLSTGNGEGHPEGASPETNGQPAPAGDPPTRSSTTPDSANSTITAKPGAPTPGTPPAPAAATPPAQPTWEERFKNYQSSTDKKFAAQAQLLQRQHAELIEARKRLEADNARKAALPRWSKDHPEFGKFQHKQQLHSVVSQKLRETDAAYRERLSKTPPEQQQAVLAEHNAARQAVLGLMSKEDYEEIEGAQRAQQEILQTLVSNPGRFIEETIIPAVKGWFAQEQQRQKAAAAVQELFTHPDYAPTVERHARELQQAIQEGVPEDYALHMAKQHDDNVALQEQIEKLKAELEAREAGTEQVVEQQRLAKTRASNVTRPMPRAAKVTDVYPLAKEWAEKNKVQIGSDRFNNKLDELAKQHGLAKPVRL